MDTLEAIKSRRSIRNYAPETINTDLLSEIATYWLYAPSAHNQQARKYYIISNKEDRIFLSEVMEYWKMLKNAWWCIIACYDENSVKSIDFIQQDMWASIENVLLAAHEKWIWTVWLWLYPHQEPIEKIRQHFNLQKNIIPFAIISLWFQDWILPEKIINPEWKIEIIN